MKKLPAIGSRRSAAERSAAVVALLIIASAFAGSLYAHDLFIRADSFYVAPNSTVNLRLLSGSFDSSENAIDRARVRDISLVGPRGWVHLDTTAWSASGNPTVLKVSVGAEGTYLVGASLAKREIALTAKEFNAYLKEDGVPDILALRKRRGELGKNARERYSKHIKTLIQSGALRTGNYREVLGYPAEIVVLDNPYQMRPGRSLRVLALVDGKPAAGQALLSGGKNGSNVIRERTTRTNSMGIAVVPLREKGQWYLKFIRMVPVAGDSTVDYESKWATLTFEIR